MKKLCAFEVVGVYSSRIRVKPIAGRWHVGIWTRKTIYLVSRPVVRPGGCGFSLT